MPPPNLPLEVGLTRTRTFASLALARFAFVGYAAANVQTVGSLSKGVLESKRSTGSAYPVLYTTLSTGSSTSPSNAAPSCCSRSYSSHPQSGYTGGAAGGLTESPTPGLPYRWDRLVRGSVDTLACICGRSSGSIRRARISDHHTRGVTPTPPSCCEPESLCGPCRQQRQRDALPAAAP